jgi:hypothetical protein
VVGADAVVALVGLVGGSVGAGVGLNAHAIKAAANIPMTPTNFHRACIVLNHSDEWVNVPASPFPS